MKSPLKPQMLGLALVAVTVGLYWQTTYQDFAVIDDDDYVSSNPRVKEGLSWEAAQWAFTTYRPEQLPFALVFWSQICEHGC